MAAVDRDPVLGPEPVHDLELLSEHLLAHARGRERKAERLVLALHPPRPEPELHSAARDVVGRRDRVCEHRRGTKRHRSNHRAETQNGRACRETGDDRPGVMGDLAELVACREVVVSGKERRDGGPFARIRKRAPVVPGDTSLRDDQQVQFHRSPSVQPALTRRMS